MNWRFWFFGKAAGTGNPTREHAAAPKQPASHPTQIIATLSDEDRKMFKSQHEQVMTKLNKETSPQMSAADMVELRKARMQAMTKVLYGIIILTLVVPYGLMNDMFSKETLPTAAFLATVSIVALSAVLSYIIREAECITPLQLNTEIATQTEDAYRNVWRWIPCGVIITLILWGLHLKITDDATIIGTAAGLIIGIGGTWNIIHIFVEILRKKSAANKWYQLFYKIMQTCEIYAFITLFLINTIVE